ncbi:MAG: Helix-turn-helix protein [uncultured bacterium]|nr:MAG: Helix-turn-helix protein [uncultured bacterium]
MNKAYATTEKNDKLNKGLDELYGLVNSSSSKPSVSWEKYKEESLKDPEFYEAYKEQDPEFEIVSQIIKARIEQHLSQKELAERVGTKQSNISRLERGDYNPSLQFLKKVAKGLGKELHISFK